MGHRLVFSASDPEGLFRNQPSAELGGRWPHGVCDCPSASEMSVRELFFNLERLANSQTEWISSVFVRHFSEVDEAPRVFADFWPISAAAIERKEGSTRVENPPTYWVVRYKTGTVEIPRL